MAEYVEMDGFPIGLQYKSGNDEQELSDLYALPGETFSVRKLESDAIEELGWTFEGSKYEETLSTIIEEFTWGELVLKWDSLEGYAMILNQENELHFFGQIMFKIDIITIMRCLNGFRELEDDDSTSDDRG